MAGKIICLGWPKTFDKFDRVLHEGDSHSFE